MKKFFQIVVFSLCSFALCSSALAGEKGTADEAVALVKKAIAYIKANGKEKAYAEFQSAVGAFRDRDLYIFVDDLNGNVLAQGANPKLVGLNTLQLKDIDGKFFVRDFIELAKTQGKGWIQYKWPNPVTKIIEQKATYVEKFDDLVVGCGIYK